MCACACVCGSFIRSAFPSSHKRSLANVSSCGCRHFCKSVQINNIIAQTGIDLVQLHGDESPEIAALIHAPCIRVLHLPPSASSVVEGHNGVDLAAITQQWAGKAVALLVDTRVPGSAGGGTGAVFDWSLVSAAGAPVLIAGGLTPNNVNEAVLVSSAVIGVDASSALEVENRPGEKDHEKIRDFIFNARK